MAYIMQKTDYYTSRFDKVKELVKEDVQTISIRLIISVRKLRTE